MFGIGDFVKAVQTVGGGVVDVVQAIGGGGGGSNLPVLPTQPAYDEGWMAGKQWYDPGEWYQDVPSNGGNGSGVPSIPVTVSPQAKTVAKAPPGYVIVTCRNGQKVAMLKEVARRYGYWRPRRKPPIKPSEWKALMQSERVIKKLKTVQKRAGVIQRAKGRRSH